MARRFDVHDRGKCHRLRRGDGGTLCRVVGGGAPYVEPFQQNWAAPTLVEEGERVIMSLRGMRLRELIQILSLGVAVWEGHSAIAARQGRVFAVGQARVLDPVFAAARHP